MDFDLTEEQRAFRDLARGFAQDEIAPHAALRLLTLREPSRRGGPAGYDGA
jgi:alkylation response protein AidB-like acyl-CoA dehydrogenase